MQPIGHFGWFLMLACCLVVSASGQNLIQLWKLDDIGLAYSGGSQPGWGTANLSNSVVGGVVAKLHNANDPANNPLTGQPGATLNTGTAIKLQTKFQWVELGNVSPGTGAFTIALWFAPGLKQDGVDAVISTRQPHRWGVDLTGAQGVANMSLDFYHDGVRTNSLVTGGVIAGQWHHLALARDASGHLEIYLNGAVVLFAADTAAFTNSTGGVWLNRYPSFGATGGISTFDDVRFYDGALSDAQIAALANPTEPPGCPELPGVPIKYSPASTQIYLGSPAIVILPNGDYLASHDYFGLGSSESTLGQTFLYRSTDRGTNWTLLGQINQMVSGAADTNGCFWNHYIQLDGQLYSIANKSGSGSGGYMVMRRSTNNGGFWTYVEPPPTSTGRPFLTTTWRPGHTYVVKHDRLWLGMERGTGLSGDFGDNYIAAMFAPTNSDLLAPTNWSASTTVQRSTSWLGGTFKGWLEANLLEDRLGGLVIMLRVDNRYSNGAGIGGKAALVRVNYTGGTNATTSFSGGNFDPAAPNGSGFVDFPGGITRFTVRFDPVSDRYWTLCNYIPRAFRNNAYNAERFRNILVLASSPDLKDWTAERIVMADWRIYSDNPAIVASAFDGNQTDYGFQYADWVFDGEDIVATVRTGFCDQFGGSNSGHDANYYLFRRVENFRSNAGPETVRITAAQFSPATGAAQIQFATRPARLYRLEASTNLVTWVDAGLSFEGYGAQAAFDLADQTASRCFYRIVESASWLP